MELLKKKFEEVEKHKDNIKLEIQNIFTKIRNALNSREEQLLIEIDNFYNNKYLNEDIIKKGEKLPKQIQISLEKGQLIEKEWDNNNLNSYINDCLNIENSIKFINIINENINKYNIIDKLKIKYISNVDNLIEIIKSFGKITHNKYSLRDCPINIKKERKYIVTGDNKNIFTKISLDGEWMGTICQNELDKSKDIHKWKIKILKTNCKAIMVGVATNDFDINSSYYNCGFFFNFFNLGLYSGPPYNYEGKKTNLREAGNEIVVIFNMKKKTLKFIINGEDKGDSYTNIPVEKPLFPAILLCYQNDSVEIDEIE